MSNPEQPTNPDQVQASSYGEHITKLTEELQAMADQTNANNNTEIAPTDTDRLQVFDGVTTPQSRRYEPGEQYRFLIHGVLGGSEARAGELGASGTSGFDRTGHDRPLNCSLIDSVHTTTFEGKNGFIIKPPTDGEAVVAAYASDAGVNDSTAEGAVPNATELLASTNPADYNQVNVTRGRIEGVYIRVRPDGAELGSPGQNAQLRQLAETHGWPVAEIVVSPLDLKAGEPELTTEVMGDGLTKISIDLPENGSILKFAIVKYDDLDRARQANEKAHFTFDEHGIDIRLRQIDEYGQSGFGNITDSAILARVADRIAREVMPGVDEQTRDSLEHGLQRLLSEESIDKSNEKISPDAAFEQHYTDMDSDYYKTENDKRAKEAKVQITKYERDGHQIVTLAAIKVDSEGKTIDGHDYAPKSRNAADIEAAFQDFLRDAGKPAVVFEGKPRDPYDSRDESVEDAAESGLIQHLATESDIKAISGEPDDKDLMIGLEAMGYDRQLAEAYLLSRGLPSLLEKNPDFAKDLGIHLHPKAAELELDGYHAFSPQERDIIIKKGATEQIFREMNQQIQEFVPAINQLYGQEILIIEKDGTVCLRDDLRDKEGLQNLWKILAEGSELRLGLLRDSMRLRDKHIADTIAQLHSQGYDVFSPYGGSHVITQRPVMEALYGTPNEKNY